MRALRIPVALGAIVGMVAFTAWFMGWPLERAIYLAPVIVIGFAALAGLLILWVAGIGLLALLSVLGVELPREG